MKLLKLFAELSIPRMAIVALFVAAGYFFMYYDNGEKIEEQIRAVEGDLALEKAKRTEIERRMKNEEQMRGNVMQLAANLELVKTKIPNEFNEIEISTIVNRVSASSQVKVIMLKRSTNKVMPKSAVTGAELIEEVNFDIQMTGSFSAIVLFVEQLSKETKIIKIRNFTLQKANDDYTAQDMLIKFVGEIVGFKQTSISKAAKPSTEVKK